ncbi:uncharacterized protein LOC121972539 [Zingiber officinale]|uniref:uncharacterized protein LOC121972539 n=1 Tax=Zingiber officinale TaxID=94328 RepID=UPI001C4CF57B|nr:uncharacterized protein LOC121972539 [Zingiber officinale]
MEGLTFPSSWRMALVEFLRSGATPSDQEEAYLLRKRVGQFTLIEDQLYKKAFARPLLKCIGSEDAEYILREMHEGSCGRHPGDRSLARKILLAGDTFGRPSRRALLEQSPPACPFVSQELKEWCEGYGIQQAFTSVAYPQSNGQTEVANREILRILRARLDHMGGSWVDELPSVMWAIRTTPKEGTGATPFHLVYGGEAVIPVKVGVESDRLQYYDEDNVEQRLLELDLVDEACAKAVVRLMT